MPWVKADEVREREEESEGRWVKAGGEDDPRNAIAEALNKINLPGAELRSAPEDVNVFSKYTNAIDNAISRMFKDPEKEKARNANIVAMAQKHKLPLNLVDGYFNTLKEGEFESTDVNLQKTMKGIGVFGGAAAVPLIAHGLWAAPLLTLGGIALMEGTNEAVSVVNHVRKGKWAEYRPLKGAASVEDTEYGKDMANLISLVGGLAAGGIGGAKFIPKGKSVPELSNLITKKIIQEGGIPKKVWLDGEQVAEIISGRPNVVFKGGEKGSNWIPEEIIEFYKECGLSGSEARQAIKFGLDIEVSTDKIIKMVDRPYWERLKGIMKMDPYQRIVATEKGGRVTYKLGNENGEVVRPPKQPTIAGELTETAGVTEEVNPVGRGTEGATDIAPRPVENTGGQTGAKGEKGSKLTLAIRDGDRVFVAEKERIHGDLLARLVDEGKIEGERAWLELANSKSAMGWVDEDGNYYGKDEAVRLMNGEAKVEEPKTTELEDINKELDANWEKWIKEDEGLSGRSVESVIDDPNATLGELEDALTEVKGVLDNLGAARRGFDKIIRAKDKADRIQRKADKRGDELAVNRFETQKALAQMRSIKARIKEMMGGQKVGNVVSEYDALKAAFKKAEQQSKVAFREGNKLGAEKIKTKMKEMKLIEKNREWLKADIKKKINSMKKMAARKGMDADYRELLQSMLADYDLAVRSDKTIGKRMNTREFIEREKSLGNIIDIPDKVMDIVYRTPLAEMTLDELWDLHDAVIMLGKLGILKSKLLAGAKARKFEKVKWDIIEEVEERMGVPEKEGGPLISERETKREGMWHKVRQISSEFVKIEYLVEKVDNWKKNGPLYNALLQPMVDGVVKRFELEHATAERMKPAFSILKERWKDVLSKKIKIAGVELTKENAIMIALNSGNEGNIRNLMEGNKLTRDQIDKIAMSLSADERQFVNEVWDVVNSFFQKIQKINRDLTGNKIERVDGFYFPIITDAELSTMARVRMADEDMFEITMLRAKVKNGMTIRRKPNAVAGPLNLTFDVIFRHLNDVINYVSFAVPVRDAQKLILDPEISGTLIKRLGKENYDQMLPWVRDIANPRSPITGGERVLATLKNNAAIAMMGWSLSVSFLQPLAYTQTINRIGWGNAVRSLQDFYRNPIDNVKFILENDTWMYERTRTLDRDIREFMQAKNMEEMFKDHTIRDSFFSIMTATDRLATFPTWWAGYQMEMRDSGDHQLAVEAGRKLVRETQGSGMTMDTPRAMRRQGLKIFTMFQSFFSSTYGESWKDWHRWKDGDINFGRLMLSWWWIYILPGAVSTILYNYIRKGKIDTKDTVSGVAGYAAGSIPIAGSLINSVLEGWEYRPSPIVKLPSEIVKMTKAKTAGQFAEHGVSAFGYVAGLPTRQVLLTADFVDELTKGNVEPGRLLYRPEKKNKGSGYKYK